MSKKSQIYHRSGCRFVQRIESESLITFDFDDYEIGKLKPCKCCCNLRNMYREYKPNLRDVFADLDISVSVEGDNLKATTPWYKWAIWLEPSSQNIKLYHEEWNEEYQEYVLIKCQEFEKTKKLSTAMKYIAHEEKIAVYPEVYRKQALEIEQVAKEKNLIIEFDETDLYVLTDMAAWKIAYGYHFDWYKLLHCPFDGKTMTIEEAKTAHYHQQMDVPKSQSPLKHVKYIVKHDEAKKIENVDYRRLPQKTKKQKKYYRQAQNRARRESISRVWDIFAELESK